MTQPKQNQPIDFSEAKQPSDYIEQEAEKSSKSDTAKLEQEYTYERTAENQTAHQQNITAHIPGGGVIADSK